MYEKMIGEPINDQLEADSWLKNVVEEDRYRVTEEFSHRAIKPLEIRFKLLSGPLSDRALRFIRLRSVPVATEGNKPSRVIGLFKDESIISRLEQESMQKTSWVRTVNHELRNRKYFVVAV